MGCGHQWLCPPQRTDDRRPVRIYASPPEVEGSGTTPSYAMREIWRGNRHNHCGGPPKNRRELGGIVFEEAVRIRLFSNIYLGDVVRNFTTGAWAEIDKESLDQRITRERKGRFPRDRDAMDLARNLTDMQAKESGIVFALDNMGPEN